MGMFVCACRALTVDSNGGHSTERQNKQGSHVDNPGSQPYFGSASRRKPLAHVPTVLVLSAICIACGESRSEGNVSPGDVDYPAANQTPTRLVELDVAMPSSLEVNMSAIYQSEITAMSQTGRPCGYKSHSKRSSIRST
jgi:hypothetical protein